MDNNYVRNSLRLLYGMALLAVIYSCANVGSPNGGPYDEAPPRFIRSLPMPNQINYKGKKVEIFFDELIQLDKPSENVIVTPPQQNMPIVRAFGKKVGVELLDTLKDDVTYTIDFTNSIADNNEKNVLENFTFAFSTGSVIDTLEVSGVLLNAQNLEPMPGITIGLHANLEDSAFVRLPFDRTSRTNDKGKFTIRNIKPGTYRIYALNDVNRDYRFDQPGEEIAFDEKPVTPTFELTTRQDTTWKDSTTVDTIRTVPYTHFLPDNIALYLFKEDFERQYMVKPERPDEYRFVLRFNAPVDTLPLLVPLNFTPKDSSWYYAQKMEENRHVNYWLTDSTEWKRDTLEIAVTYPKSDSLNMLRPQTDTLFLAARKRPPEKKKKRKKDEPEPIVFLGMQVNAPSSMDVLDTLSVIFSEPVVDVSKSLFKLEQKIDTLWNPVEFDFLPDSINSLKFILKREWKFAEEYKLSMDSAVIFSLYGKWNDKSSSEFKVKKEDEYSQFYLNIVGLDSIPAYVELLNGSDQPVRKGKVESGGVLFWALKPDKYYARLVLDQNDNGKWDTGNYADKKQPEMVFYSPKQYEVMANWKVEETWNIYETSIDKQKPLEITKNKPKEITKKKRDYKNEGRQSSSSGGGSMRNSSGLPF